MAWNDEMGTENRKKRVNGHLELEQRSGTDRRVTWGEGRRGDCKSWLLLAQDSRSRAAGYFQTLFSEARRLSVYRLV